MLKMKIRSGDEVVVISGRSKGKVGRVVKVMRAKGRVIVEGLNMVSRHVSPSMKDSGGIVEKEASIHVSNVALRDPLTKKPIKVGYRVLDDGRKVRVSRKSGEILDR